jgi:hypothetical protein
MNRSRRSAFTREERKAAMWALLIAVSIAAVAMLVQQWTQPSLGPWGSERVAVSMPGVLDAQPVASSL